MNRQQAQAVKQQAISQLARAFTNPVRLQLVGALNQGEASVDVLARKIGQSRANTSAQLKVLLESHVVSLRREGRHVYYQLKSDAVRRLWSALQEVAALEDPGFRELVRTWMGEPAALSRRAGRALLDEVKANRVALIDLRAADEYQAGHIPGALSVPLDALREHSRSLPADREIVAYCRGRYCIMAAEGVQRLRQSGHPVRNLFAGIADWERHRLPVDRGAAPADPAASDRTF